jgi:hypothetical protein
MLLQVGYSRTSEGEGVTAMECFIMLLTVFMIAPAMHGISQLARMMSTHYGDHVGGRAEMLAILKLRNMPDELLKDTSDYYSHCWEALQVIYWCCTS